MGNPKTPVIGVFATSDPRIDDDSRTRCRNIIRMAADKISGVVVLPDETPVPVVYSDMLVDGEPQADIVARQFRDAGVDILVCVPDTWAFPGRTLIALVQQFPPNTPINITTGNSGPKPGVVFGNAINGALAQYGRLAALNVGNWPDTGQDPEMSERAARSLIDWCYAAVATVGLRGKRIVMFGHDSMEMETALAHVIPTRNIFGIEICREEMLMVSDMLEKGGGYKKEELDALREWITQRLGSRIALADDGDRERFDKELAMYLIVRNLMHDLNAVGGGFMSQLPWGSDPRGRPRPVADLMESLFNSSEDHNGTKPPMPFATEADCQGELTMLFLNWLSGGNPPLFMDFRKVWEPWEIQKLAKEIGLELGEFAGSNEDKILLLLKQWRSGTLDERTLSGLSTLLWHLRGCFDGDNSGSASFDWAARPGTPLEEAMEGVSMPQADEFYFPGRGNSVTFLTPGGIEGIIARLGWSDLSGMFSMVWDQALTVQMPFKLSSVMMNLTTPEWPHTFWTPMHASVNEMKQLAWANHIHGIWNLRLARLQHWMDMNSVLSATPWAEKPAFREGIDRWPPLLHAVNGGPDLAKMMLAGRQGCGRL